MERLTERDEFGNADIIGVDSEDLQLNLDFKQMNKVTDALNKLAEYEDLEEQGLLLRLLCKVGDTVWNNDFRTPKAYKITGFSFGTSDSYIDEPVTAEEVIYYQSDGACIEGSFASSEIGKTVFLTQAEAEQKLKEMEGSHEGE